MTRTSYPLGIDVEIERLRKGGFRKARRHPDPPRLGQHCADQPGEYAALDVERPVAGIEDAGFQLRQRDGGKADLVRGGLAVDEAFVQRLKSLIERAGLPVRGPVLDASDNAGRYLELMRIDKKSEAGEIRFVLIDGPGKAVVRGAPDALVREVIDACCA